MLRIRMRKDSGFYTLSEAATLRKYGCRKTLSSAFNEGKLRGRRFGRVVVTSIEALEEFAKPKKTLADVYRSRMSDLVALQPEAFEGEK